MSTILKCKRIDEKLGITIMLDSPILNEYFYTNLEKIILDSDLEIMLIFFCEEPLLGLKYGLKIYEIINIVKFILSVSRRKVFCDIYSDLSFDKIKMNLLNKILSSLDGDLFNYSVTPSYAEGVDIKKFTENIELLDRLNILGEISCVISKEGCEKDLTIFKLLQSRYPNVISNPRHGEESWFFEKFGLENTFYSTHNLEYSCGTKKSLSIYDLRDISFFKGYKCNKKNHVSIKLSGLVYFCFTDLIDNNGGYDLYKEIPSIDFLCDKEKCQHEDNVSVCK